LNDFVYLLSNVGFPIVVCLYLLMRIEGKIEALTGAILSLESTIASGSGPE